MIFDKVNCLIALEIAAKEEEILKRFYPNDYLNTFRKTFVEKAIEFCQNNDLYLFFSVIPDGLNKKNIDQVIIVIDFLQTLPLKLPPLFIKTLLKLEDEELKQTYPNFYIISNEEYLLKMKADALKVKQTTMISKKIR